MDRNDVYKAIDTEREYQAKVWGVETPEGNVEIHKPVEAYILYMEEYLAKARTAISHDIGTDTALEMLRKVVGLGVVCFEQNGVKPRDLSNISNKRSK